MYNNGNLQQLGNVIVWSTFIDLLSLVLYGACCFRDRVICSVLKERAIQNVTGMDNWRSINHCIMTIKSLDVIAFCSVPRSVFRL